MRTLLRACYYRHRMHMLWTLIISFLLMPVIPKGGAAYLTGSVRDTNGAPISGAQAELRSEDVTDRIFQTTTTNRGVYDFSGLLEGRYTLKLVSSGFRRLTVTSIHISDGEHKRMPPLELPVAAMGGCTSPAVDHLRLLPSTVIGNVGGTIRLDQEVIAGKSPPVVRADVILICGKGAACRITKTNSEGEFLFRDLSPGSFTVRVMHPGFYREERRGYEVEVGRELIYSPIYIERCVLGNCDPEQRPKKPLTICE
jgi:hypothetical protein